MTDDSTVGPGAVPVLSSVLSPEDGKLVTLARGALGRAGLPWVGDMEGAAVRDGDGRTYAAATVRLPSLRLTALQAAVAAAVASGASGLEAAVIARAVGSSGAAGPDDASVAAARDLGAPLLMVVDTRGSVLHRMTW